MLSQDEIDNLLSSLSVGESTAAQAKLSGSGASNPNQPALEGGGGSTSQSIEDILKQERLKNYKLYNFRRPDKFSKDHLRALQTIHETFARQLSLILSAYLRMSIEMDVVSVDQLTYDEFVRSMPRPITVCILEFAPLPGQLLFGMGYEVTMSMIDRMLGGPGTAESKARELTDIETSLIKRVIERTTICLEEAWRSMMNIHATLMGMEDSYAMIQVASPGEIVALVTFEVTLGNKDSGLMSLCVPYPVVEGVIDQLSAQHIFHKQHTMAPQEQSKILQKMHYANIPVNVLLGGTSISIADLMDLSVGDVIKLDRESRQEMLLCVNHKPKFLCRPGTMKDHLAVSVASAVQSVDALEGFGLSEETLDDEREEEKPPPMQEAS